MFRLDSFQLSTVLINICNTLALAALDTHGGFGGRLFYPAMPVTLKSFGFEFLEETIRDTIYLVLHYGSKDSSPKIFSNAGGTLITSLSFFELHIVP